MNNVNTFLQQMKTRCEAKSAEMAKLELSVWDDHHESELKKNFGFTDDTLHARKHELTVTGKNCQI